MGQLPKLKPLQLFLRGYLGPFVGAKADLEKNRSLFEGLGRKMLAMLEDIPDSQLRMKVLVPPQSGLEEDARYWSAIEVMEHVLLAGRGVQTLIGILAKGEKLNVEPDLSVIAPKSERAPHEILKDFRAMVENCMSELDVTMQGANTEVTYPHPTYGDFNVYQWHWLMGAHTAIHYKQLKNIVKGLPFEAH